MAFKMNFNQEELKGVQPVPAGLYKVRLEGFKPKASKNGDSTNLNAEVTIVGGGEFDGKKLFAGLNSKIPNWIQDFVHSFGLEMEDQLSDNPSIPGVWDADPSTFKADDPSTYKYAGPLLGRVAEWEVGMGEYQGKAKNEIRQFICAVPDCASRFPLISHTKDMQRRSA